MNTLFQRTKANKQLIRLKVRLIAIALLFLIPSIYFLKADQSVEVATIQGKILKRPITLMPFELEDQNGKNFTNKDLQKKWHIISFGYSQCPDVCPTTLMTMVELAKSLKNSGIYNDTRFVFYSVDPMRDTSKVLSTYINYFDSRFIALRANNRSNPNFDNNFDNSFESNLGIKVKISDNGLIEKDYKVSHNQLIFVIDPNAALQAVFFPDRDALELGGYRHQQLYQDFLVVKDHFLNSRYKDVL